MVGDSFRVGICRFGIRFLDRRRCLFVEGGKIIKIIPYREAADLLSHVEIEKGDDLGDRVSLPAEDQDFFFVLRKD